MYFNWRLILIFLSLFLAFLPSFEAPKNIFLLSYLVTALYRQSQLPSIKWSLWDWVFLSLIFSSFLSSLFPFVAGGSELKGFRGMLLWITFGWTLFRSDYNEKEKKFLFFVFPQLVISYSPHLLCAIWKYNWMMLLFIIALNRISKQLLKVILISIKFIY